MAVQDGSDVERRWLVLALLAVSLVMLGLDLMVLNVALPTLVTELGASTSDLQWIIDSYALMAGSLGAALQIAERLPGDLGATVTDAARGAFVDAVPPAMYVGAIAAALLLAFTLFRKEKS
jgi:hypothetical protein